MSDYIIKTCTKCNTEKPISDFGKDKSRKDGVFSWCKACTRLNSNQYRANNQEAVLKRKALYRANNREILRTKALEYYYANRDRVRMSATRWRNNNKEKV